MNMTWLKSGLGLAIGTLVSLPALPAWADLELPAPSLAAKVSQRVGLTDVALEYSSPAAKGRKIWGEVVPWDKPWRTGANAATKITFSKDVTFGGQPVPAGSYAIVTIPSEKGAWTVVLNKDTGLWQGGKAYDAANDLAKAQVKPTAAPQRERMTFVFDKTTDTDTSLDLEWDKLRISLPIHTDTVAQAKASIKATLDNAWRPFANAARYESETLKDHATAMTHVDRAIAIQPTWYGHWIKAEIYSRTGKWAEARQQADIAWDLGQKDAQFFYKDQVEKARKDWKDKK